MFKKIAVILPTLALTLSPVAVLAGEVGVSNQYTDGWSRGKTYVNIDSKEFRTGKEGTFSYAHKEYDSWSVDLDKLNVNPNKKGVQLDGKISGNSENVEAGSVYASFGSYTIDNKVKGFSETHFGNTNHEHRTTAFSNL